MYINRRVAICGCCSIGPLSRERRFNRAGQLICVNRWDERGPSMVWKIILEGVHHEKFSLEHCRNWPDACFV